MSTQPLIVKAALQIAKPAPEVYEAIVNPDIMRNYFISKSTGRMEEGKTVIWNFPEFEFDAPVRVGKLELDKYVSFYWEGSEGNELLVEMALSSQPDHSTVVRITEKSMDNNEAGLAWLVGNTEGWANFLACMKAWLEYGIHLRQGAFDFMKG